jgi:dynein heavy chain
MNNPPNGVKVVMAAVCVLKGIPADRINDPNKPGSKIYDFWGPSKKLLGDLKFLPDLIAFDKDNINQAAVKKIKEEYLRDPEFEPSRVAKASSAAEGLCKWCMAMVKYDEIKKVVAPKEKALKEAEDELLILNAALAEKQSQLKMVEDRLALLQKNLDENTTKKENLEAEVGYPLIFRY